MISTSETKTDKKTNSTKKPQVLGKGSFGCVVNRDYPCSTSDKKTRKIVSKIQYYKSVSDRETQLGVKIRAIPNHSNFFAPVLETCMITYATVEVDGLKECGFLDEKHNQFSTNKMKYVGKLSIAKYLMLQYQSKPKQFFRTFFKSYYDILDGLIHLNKATIVHNDLRGDNILCRDTTGKPIIIDFGQAYDDEMVASKDYKNVFETYGPDYPPWCMELHIICFIVFKLSNTLEQVTEEIITQILNEVTSTNRLFTLYSIEERDSYISNLKKYLAQFHGKTGIDIITELIKYRNTWDNYAVAVIYFRIMKDMFLTNYFLTTEFTTLLKSILFAMPNVRMTAEQTKAALLKMTSSLSKKQTKKEEEQLEKDSPKHIDKIKTQIATSIFDELKEETKLLSKKGEPPKQG